MRKICTFSFVCLTILSLSCKKSGSDGSNAYIKATVNDTAKTFNIQAKAYRINNAGTSSLVIAGNASNSTVEALSLLISTTTTNPIEAKTYTEAGGDGFFASAVYNPNMPNIEYVEGSSAFNPLKIVITSIDDKTVKGTFSGNLIFVRKDTSTGPVDPATKNFTQGEFSVNF